MESNHAFPVTAISHSSLGTVPEILRSSLQHLREALQAPFDSLHAALYTAVHM
jgi:sirohydrochlorin ferrochelatase